MPPRKASSLLLLLQANFQRAEGREQYSAVLIRTTIMLIYGKKKNAALKSF